MKLGADVLSYKEKLEAALNSMSDAVFISDIEGNFIHFNQAFATFHKFKNIAECAKTLNEYPLFLDVYSSSGELLPLDQWAVPRALRGEVGNNVEFILQRRDTGEKWVGSYNFAPVRNEQGAIVGSVVTGRDVTAQKEVIAALRYSESEFRLLAESMPQIVWITQPDGGNIYFNQQWVDYTGLTLEASYGDGWNKPFHADDQKRAWTAWQNAVNHNATYSIECRLRRFDGAYRWWLVRGVPALDDNGEIYKWFGTCTDIHEIKQSEQKLIESEKRYRDLFENMFAGFFLVEVDEDDQGNPVDLIIVAGNAMFEKATRLNLQEVIGKRLTHVLPSIKMGDVDLVEIYTQVALTGQPLQFELSSARQPGIYYLITAYQAAPKQCAIIFLDITESKKAEAQIHKLSQVVEHSPASIIITDLEANIIYVNEGFTKNTGYTQDEMLGKNPRVLQSGKTSRRSYEELWECLSKGEPWIGEFINLKKDGSEHIEFVAISPIRDNSGKIINYLSIKEDITNKKRTEAQIIQLAHFDQLTGLPNRILLQDRFQYALSLAQRNNQNMAVMFLDLDNFKNTNDAFGHSVGDQLLIEISKRLKSIMREEDTVARFGGDEFIFILPGTDENGAANVAGKIIDQISLPCKIGNHELMVTSSIGITIYPDDGKDMEVLSQNADTAMYQAKQMGRNCFRFFTQSMHIDSSRHMLLSNELRRALECNQLHLHYQPQISIEDNKLIGVEALLRWNHPTIGIISPAEFIPIAEFTGLIIPIGEWVLRTAASQLKSWLDAGLPNFVMAVNLSAVQFKHIKLPEMVTNILAEVGLPPENLELELTEAVAMDDPLAAIRVMDYLHAQGIRMSIDDFGTGYSSLSYLKRFKVYKLKIDQSFVRDISDDPDDKAIVAAIISLASSLGMHTIAEGVETASQLAYLKTQGCNEVQGYYFSKPLPAKEFEAFANERRFK